MRAIYANDEDTISNIKSQHNEGFATNSTSDLRENQHYISEINPTKSNTQLKSLIKTIVGKDMIAENAEYYGKKFLEPTGFTF